MSTGFGVREGKWYKRTDNREHNVSACCKDVIVPTYIFIIIA